MRIKHAEGQTLLTLLRLCFVAIACLCVGNMQAYADAFYQFIGSAGDMARDFIAPEEDASVSIQGEPVVLYFQELLPEGGGYRIVYQQLYKTGSESAYGLTDAAGRQLVPEQYQDILALPHAYVLKSGGLWQFVDAETFVPLSERLWEEVQPSLSEKGMLQGNLVRVRQDGLYGAVDLTGNVVIEPAYDEFVLYSYQVEWPLIAVRQNGYYGYLDMAGNIVVDLIYDYAVMSVTTVFADENDATGTTIPIIYVLRNEDWGAIYRQGDGPSAVDWQVEPSAEALAAYTQSQQSI